MQSRQTFKTNLLLFFLQLPIKVLTLSLKLFLILLHVEVDTGSNTYY